MVTDNGRTSDMILVSKFALTGCRGGINATATDAIVRGSGLGGSLVTMTITGN